MIRRYDKLREINIGYNICTVQLPNIRYNVMIRIPHEIEFKITFQWDDFLTFRKCFRPNMSYKEIHLKQKKKP